MSHVITRANSCLPDSSMKLWDHRNKVVVSPDWEQKDKTFQSIESALMQVIGASSTGVHIIPEHTPLSNQGIAGSCVANAWCDMLEMLDGLDGTDNVEQLSRRFLYWCARYLTGDMHKDGGTYLRSAAHQLLKVGIIEERDFQYYDSPEYITGLKASPELDLYTMASNNIKISGFYSVNGSGSQKLKNIETAIRANHPVVFGTPVSSDFQRYRGGGTIFTEPKTSIGGHAMITTGVGYDGGKRWWLWRNSWGSRWGDSGHVKVDDNYMLACTDMWIGTRMSELVG